ncbi:UNVERIFIED_CONTAM: hypothetical protein HDU68_002195 [Siphonaria sp. JEL0065]|nr:hypothetical protein HDU68_002195 [Siphonaria sp. JEL0065]
MSDHFRQQNRVPTPGTDVHTLKQTQGNVASSALLGSREGSKSNLFQAEPSFDSSLLASEIKKKGQSNELLNEVSLSLKKTAIAGSELPSKPVSVAKTALALSPKSLVEKLNTSPSKQLLLDVRSLQDFNNLRIKNSANIILPNLILKRIKKGGISSFQLENFLTNDESKAVFKAWNSQEGVGCSIVVFDEDINQVEDPESDSYALLKAILGSQLVSSRPNLAVYFLNGGLDAFSNEPSAIAFLDGSQIPQQHQHQHATMGVNTTLISATPLQLTTSPSSTTSDYSTPSLMVSASSPMSVTFGNPSPMVEAIKTPFKSNSLPAGTPSLGTPSSAKSGKRPSFTISIAPTPTTATHNKLSTMDEVASPAMISPLPPPKPDHISQITEYVFLGSEVVPTAPDAVSQLQSYGITHVLNMAKEVRDEALMLPGTGISFKWLGVFDHPDEEIDGPLRDGVAFITEAMKSNPSAKVLVHCKAGRSRSVAVVLAYLVTVQKMTLKDAYELANSKRNGIIPNIGFMLALLHLELEIHGVNTEVSGSSLSGLKSI